MSTSLTADTSVVVPALTSWHEHHHLARPATAGIEQLPAHVLAESFSVLTRLPRGLALRPADAVRLLMGAFPGPPLTLQAAEHHRLLGLVCEAGLRGGAVYDAVVGATAVQADTELLTLDARATASYRAVGAHFRPPE